MAVNAKAQPRRAQLPRCVEHAAPTDSSRAEAAGLTAMGEMQRARTEARWARRAPATAPARCEALAEGTCVSTGGGLGVGLTNEANRRGEASAKRRRRRVRVERQVRPHRRCIVAPARDRC
jgi:hypothetical protein